MNHVLWKPVRWVGEHQLVVLLGLLPITAGLWAFLELADRVSEGRTQRHDEQIIRALRKPSDPATPIGPGWLVEAGRDVTALGSVSVIVLLTGAVAGFLLVDRKASAALFVLGATGTGFILAELLKGIFRRPRPDVVPHLMRAYQSSFPSGHSMISAVVYLTLGSLLTRLVPRARVKAYILGVALFLTGLVGVSRVYMGVHYPTDVLAGWSAGLVWASVCWLIGRRLQRRGVIEPES